MWLSSLSMRPQQSNNDHLIGLRLRLGLRHTFTKLDTERMT
jgi:hypothetical protein